VALETEDRVGAEVKDFSPLDLRELERAMEERDAGRIAAGGGGSDGFRAVAPPVMSFAQGRRR